MLSSEDLHKAEFMWIRETQQLLIADRSCAHLKTQFGLFRMNIEFVDVVVVFLMQIFHFKRNILFLCHVFIILSC